jgi:aspartyl-tRNA(Asn)/glutamyl-tRNA(Gln) amidotransferase subunit B
VNAQIARHSVFARKNYFYPDLPKGYQISQYELPIVANGRLRVQMDDGRVLDVEIQRAHLEEDAGKSLHDAFHAATAIDLNRSGTPLLEIVSAPVLHSAAEAVAYMRTVHTLVRWLGICDGNMQEGSFRCDANVSVRPAGSTELGTKTELKNMNSFKFLAEGMAAEIERQKRLLDDGGAVEQETLHYDPSAKALRSLRSKEEAHDYRYFPEPDLEPLAPSAELIERVRGPLPELPAARIARFESELGLTPQYAHDLNAEARIADYFEQVAAESGDPKTAADWVLNQPTLLDSGVAPAGTAAVIRLVADGTITNTIARQQLLPLLEADPAADPQALVEREGLASIGDSDELEAMVDEVIAANPAFVEQFKGGKDGVVNALVGQVMKRTQGRADARQVQQLFRSKLS